MNQLQLPLQLPQPRQPLTDRQMWHRLSANVAENGLSQGATDAGSIAPRHADKKRTGNGKRYSSMVTVTIVMLALLLIGCAEGDAQGLTFDDLFPPLTATPGATAAPAESPTMTPTAEPTNTPPTAQPTATAPIVTVTDVTTQVHADGQQYRIVNGDNLWRIARSALRNSGAVWNNSAVGRYVAHIIQGNPAVQNNPNLIHPNQIVLLPEVTQ